MFGHSSYLIRGMDICLSRFGFSSFKLKWKLKSKLKIWISMFSYFKNRKTTYFDVFCLNFSIETKIKTLFLISCFNLSEKAKWHFGYTDSSATDNKETYNLYNWNKKLSVAFIALFTSQNQKLIKFWKFFAFDSANYSFLFIMYIGFIFDENGVFHILTTFYSFTENVSIDFEHKNFKSLIMH